MATVIKAGQTGTLLSRLSTVDLADHLREADTIVAEARLRAEEILRRGNAEVAAQRDQARRKGHAEGFESGRAEGLKDGHDAAFHEAITRFEREHAAAARMLGEAVQALDSRKEALLADARRHLVDFAVETAEQLTFRIGELHRESAVANLERALSIVSARTDVTVRANPADVATLETFASALPESVAAARHVRIEADIQITPGGCVVIAGDTRVDADLKTQAEQLIALLLGERRDG